MRKMTLLCAAILLLSGCATMNMDEANFAGSMAGAGIAAVVNPCAGISMAGRTLLHAAMDAAGISHEAMREKAYQEYKARAWAQSKAYASQLAEKHRIENAQKNAEFRERVNLENQRSYAMAKAAAERRVAEMKAAKRKRERIGNARKNTLTNDALVNEKLDEIQQSLINSSI